ncbi:S8 family serine peptidase [Colwellia sp. MEBiC06753]
MRQKFTLSAISMAMLLTGASAIAGNSPIRDSKLTVDQTPVFNQSQVGVYSIMLKLPGALHNQYFKDGIDKQQAIEMVEDEQDLLMQHITAVDPNAFVNNRVRLVNNMLHVQMTHEAANSLQSYEGIASINQLSNAAITDKPNLDQQYPFYKVNDAGKSVTVAIISSGVDYTHKALGGSGEADAYAEAWENRSNAWDGFPTDTVIGGFDFTSEHIANNLDYNPIERQNNVTDPYYGVEYVAGRGTMIAAEILKQAPDAKIYAYKTTGAKDSDAVYVDYRDYNYPALEMAIDPNMDGDTSDRADIIIIDALGSNGFYAQGDSGISSPVLDILMMRSISALGSLVVSPAGEWGEFPTYFNIAWRGASPESLTVGSVKLDGKNVSPSDFTPHGPVRGDFIMKPDAMQVGEDVNVALVGTGTESATKTDPMLAAATVAGQAAKLLAERPELSAAEAKAILVNTGNTDVKGDAEVTRIGGGVTDIKEALDSDVVVWDANSYLPNLAFGFVDVNNKLTLTRDVTIKNFSRETKRYYPSASLNGNKAGNEAIQWILPESIVIEKGKSATFSVSMVIDGEKLPEMPLKESADYTLENWSKIALNGYLNFSTSKSRQRDVVNLPWLVMPKNVHAIEKDFASTAYGPDHLVGDWGQDVGIPEWNIDQLAMEFTNTSSANQTFMTLPVITEVKNKDENKVRTEGNFLKYAASGVYDEAQCTSGKKFTVATSFFDRSDLAIAKHPDRFGFTMFQASIYFPEMMEIYGYSAFNVDSSAGFYPEGVVGKVWVELNEDAQPQTYYLDLNQSYDPANPTGRYRKSTLPTIVSPDGNTAVANVCVEDLYHHTFNDPSKLDGELGYQFATDRDAQAGVDDNILLFNPVQLGTVFDEEVCLDSEWMCENSPEWAWKLQVTALTGYKSGLAKVTGGEVSDYSHEITLAPGETAKFGLAMDVHCAEGGVGIGSSVDVGCKSGALLINTATGYVIQTAGIDDADDYLAAPLAGQEFSVYENVDNGHVVGQIHTDSLPFFGVGDTNEYSPLDIFLLNAIPGTPFNVSKDGEITVANTDAIDFEDTKEFNLVVYAKQGMDTSPEVEIKVTVVNVNDVAPQKTKHIETIVAKQGQAVSVDLSDHFIDPEGDGIAYSSDDLPAGLAISTAGEITGTPQSYGDLSANVMLSDGKNTASAQVNFAVAQTKTDSVDAGSSSSGGSFGSLVLAFLGLTTLARRRKINS